MLQKWDSGTSAGKTGHVLPKSGWLTPMVFGFQYEEAYKYVSAWYHFDTAIQLYISVLPIPTP